MLVEISFSAIMSLRLKNLILKKFFRFDSSSIDPPRKATANGKLKSSNAVSDHQSFAANNAPQNLLSALGSSRSASMHSARDSIPPVGVALSDEESSLSPSSIFALYFETLPALANVPSSQMQSVLAKKMLLCCYVFEFKDPAQNVREKEIKRQTLLELVDYVTTANAKFSESVLSDMSKMVAINLFRTFPPSAHTSSLDTLDAEVEQPSTMDPAWPHLQIVYELFLRFMVSPETDPKLARKYINQRFLLKLLNLFDSEEPRERDYLKTILHRIYGKFMVDRPFIRRAISNIFCQFIYETEKQNGVAEMLEVLGTIIDGFVVPLKEEHKLFLARVLIPLHKPKCLAVYHQQLCYCITQFIEKDPKLADAVIRGLLRYWPLTNSQKEILFLGELGEVLAVTHAGEFQKWAAPIFMRISRCLRSANMQVAERALFLWNDEHVASLIAQNRHVILPIVYGSLEMNTRHHWNPSIKGLTVNVIKSFLDLIVLYWKNVTASLKRTRKKPSYCNRDKKMCGSIWKWLLLQNR